MSTPFFHSLAALLQGAEHAHCHAELMRAQFPRRQPNWKYAWLDQLSQHPFTQAQIGRDGIDSSALAHIPSPRLVFVNGLYRPDLSKTTAFGSDVSCEIVRSPRIDLAQSSSLDAAASSDIATLFTRLNRMLADTCVRMRVREGAQVSSPLHLVNLSTPGDALYTWHHQYYIHLERHASLQCIEHHSDLGLPSHYANTLAHMTLEPQAQLNHLRIMSTNQAMTSVMAANAVLAQDSHYYRTDIDVSTGSGLSTLRTRLQGDQARVDANGVLISRENAYMDSQLQIEHAAQNTACHLLWRGIASQESALTLAAQIHILANADQADAHLSNKNLLLSPRARIQTQPILVIDADNIRASHGATVGQLDPRAIFYLRSRGIAHDQAVQLLGAAFCQAPLMALTEPFKHWAQHYLAQAIERTCNEPATFLT